MAHFRPSSRSDKFKFRAHSSHGEEQLRTFYRTVHAALTNSRTTAVIAFATCLVCVVAFSDVSLVSQIADLKADARAVFDRYLLPPGLQRAARHVGAREGTLARAPAAAIATDQAARAQPVGSSILTAECASVAAKSADGSQVPLR